MKPRVQEGDLRDKVAVTDPATVSRQTDSEAAGAPTPEAIVAAVERDQARAAQKAVPVVDASRAVSTADHPEKRRFGAAGVFASAAVMIVAIVAAALHFTAPG